ncbi:MAG: hypothetical protein DWI13_03580 [Planctomycetota bacterium]|nr:MAG: hypothetical protein DWI13_03580 [Planctomycetota bacterium]
MSSKIILGTMMFGWKVPLIDANKIMDLAVKNGIDTLDTSPSYGSGISEIMCGKLIEKYPQIKISTKFTISEGLHGNSLALHLIRQCNQSIDRLRCGEINIFTLHNDENLTNVDTFCESILVLKQKKLINNFFLSNSCLDTYIKIKLFEKLNKVKVIDGLQIRKNLLFADDLLKSDQLEASEVIYSYSPLCEGLLTGKYLVSSTPPKKSRLAQVNRHLEYYDSLRSADITKQIFYFKSQAKKIGLTLTEYSYLSLLLSENITKVIAGPSNIAQLRDAIKCEQMSVRFKSNGCFFE